MQHQKQMSWQLWPDWSSLCRFCCCLHQTSGICTSRGPETLFGDSELLRRLSWKIKGANSKRSVLLSLQHKMNTTLGNPEVPCAAALPGASKMHPTGCQPARAHSEPDGMGSSCWQLNSVYGLSVQAVCRVTWSSHSLCHLRSEIIEKEETAGFVCLFGLNMWPVQRSVVKWKTLVEKYWKNKTVPRGGSSVPQCKIHRSPIPFKALYEQV